MSSLEHPNPAPYKLPAGVLALAVHGAFFALLYFGLNWQPGSSQGMVVEIWGSLPAPQSDSAKVTAQAKRSDPVEPQKPAQPVESPGADIELTGEPKTPSSEPMMHAETKSMQTDAAAQSEQGRAGTMQSDATGKMLDEYKLRIIAKIRRNIVMPAGVPDNIQAEFNVILIPDGSVLSARLVKPSGSGVYDNAVDRAILKAQPLPLPPDVAQFERFRELHLIFRPKA